MEIKYSIQYNKFNLKKHYASDAWHPPSTLCRKTYIDLELATHTDSNSFYAFYPLGFATNLVAF